MVAHLDHAHMQYEVEHEPQTCMKWNVCDNMVGDNTEHESLAMVEAIFFLLILARYKHYRCTDNKTAGYMKRKKWPPGTPGV